MGILPLMKKLGFIFLLVSAFALSSAGRPSILIYSQDDNNQELVERIHEHERILRMNSRDYGHFSPTPRLVSPPFKLIPN
ncbi:hypothetical protein IGI04_000346 [Brassica rapa subsp. trilocularis]|uniref:Uncharacterized protein n=1 Tax=Brassica rapa subsp. trilocularis TaxID=1813537 RepID=A0ABQ7NPN3_BRACM|nr:hypothetical protein IGI04_000346 [Brassica rapa subsp. trilocularis]